MPVELSEYERLLGALRQLNTADAAIRSKIIELLVHKIEVTAEGFDINFYAGESEIERGLAHAGPVPSGHKKTTELFQVGGSKVLQNGGRCNGTNEPYFNYGPPVAVLRFGERWVKKKVDLAELVILRGSGLTYREIAARLSIGKTSVVMALRKVRG